jgi:hypothetical protein
MNSRNNKPADPRRFHRLFGVRRPRINYRRTDFPDYALMIVACALTIYLVYRHNPLLYGVGLALCAFMVVSFGIRHGLGVSTPAILRRPQDVLYAIAYKIGNLPVVYFFAGGLLLLENYFIYLTPGLPHHSGLLRQIAIGLFYLHFTALLIYRTVSLVDHWRKRELVREVLLQSSWRNVGTIRHNIRFEILHAYLTGILTHIILIAPWFLVITHAKFSLLLVPFICVLNARLHVRFLKVINDWFYRDHWLGHNSELEFLYLHGSHHDAIPSGLMAVAGNGLLEGLLRNLLGYPTAFYNPIWAFVAYSIEIHRDMDFHQYIPGIFPRLGAEFRAVGQHSTHHFGRLEPYGFGIKLDQPGFSPGFKAAFAPFPDEFSNSIRLDEELTQFEWDNPRHRWYLEMSRKYE